MQGGVTETYARTQYLGVSEQVTKTSAQIGEKPMNDNVPMQCNSGFIKLGMVSLNRASLIGQVVSISSEKHKKFNLIRLRMLFDLDQPSVIYSNSFGNRVIQTANNAVQEARVHGEDVLLSDVDSKTVIDANTVAQSPRQLMSCSVFDSMAA